MQQKRVHELNPTEEVSKMEDTKKRLEENIKYVMINSLAYLMQKLTNNPDFESI